MKKIAISSIFVVCLFGVFSSTAFADDDEDLDIESILAEEESELHTDFSAPMLGWGWDGEADKFFVMFGRNDWIHKWFSWNFRGGFGFLPTNDSFPALVIEAGVEMGPRPKFSIGPFIGAELEFEGFEPSDVYLRTGLEATVHLRTFGFEDAAYKDMGLQLSMGPSFTLWANSPDREGPSPGFLINMLFIFP